MEQLTTGQTAYAGKPSICITALAEQIAQLSAADKSRVMEFLDHLESCHNRQGETD